MLRLLSARANPELAHRLCDEAVKDKRRVEQCKLFDRRNWQEKPETLLYKLNAGVYSDYHVLVNEDNEVVCGAGFYWFEEDVYILMSRMWTRPDYRARWIGHQILEAQVQRMPTRFGMITFNEVNRPLYEKMSTLYGTTGTSWPRLWRRFKPIGSHTVNNVMQHCLLIEKHELNLQRASEVASAQSSHG